MRIVNYGKFVRMILVLSFLVIFCGIAALSATTLNERSHAYDYDTTTVYYVSSGDTLWDIAKQVSGNSHNHDTRKVIDEIQKLNNLETVDIFPGDLLTVPVFNNLDKDYQR